MIAPNGRKEKLKSLVGAALYKNLACSDDGRAAYRVFRGLEYHQVLRDIEVKEANTQPKAIGKLRRERL